MLPHHLQAKLIASLRGMVASQLQRLAWPPPLADPSGPRGAPLPWTPLEQEPAPAAASSLMKLLEALTLLQRAVQRSSFDVVWCTCSCVACLHCGVVPQQAIGLPGHPETGLLGHAQSDSCTYLTVWKPGCMVSTCRLQPQTTRNTRTFLQGFGSRASTHAASGLLAAWHLAPGLADSLGTTAPATRASAVTGLQAHPVREHACQNHLQSRVQAVQAASTEGLEEGPELWAVEAVATPLVERLKLHFAPGRPTSRPDKPEWLLNTVLQVRMYSDVLGVRV